MSSTEYNKARNPWLGLSAYQEGQVIYGRNSEIKELSQILFNNTQTVLYGRSGIGKSSIINAGIFPAARRSGLLPVSIRLEHNAGGYVSQIAQAMEAAVGNIRKDVFNDEGDKIEVFEKGTVEELVPVIDPEKETLWEYFHRHAFKDGAGKRMIPLVIFDQFEEIFTLEKDAKKVQAFFGELADLLNAVTPDYVNDATDDYADASDASDDYVSLENGSFSFLNINVPKEKVEKYLGTSDFHICFTLREDFLSYLERNTINIPVLKQNRYCLQPINEEQAASIIMNPIPGLVSKEVARKIIAKIIGDEDFQLDDIPERQVDSAILSLYLSCLYDRMAPSARTITLDLVVAESDTIIEDFYKDSVRDIPEDVCNYLEDHLVNGDARRENISLYNARKVGGLTEELQKKLVDRKLIRLFSFGGDMKIEFIHDTLCAVVRKRKEQRENTLRQKREEEKIRQLKRKNKVLLVSLVLSVLTALFFWSGVRMPVTRRYRDFTKNDTWLYGINPISRSTAEHLPYHFQLKKKGWFPWRHFDEMIAIDGYGNMTTSHVVGTHLISKGDVSDQEADSEMQTKVDNTCRWVFVPDAGGRYVMQERAYDKDGVLVWCYNRNLSDKKDVYITNYTDGFGFPCKMRSGLIYFLRETFDEDGMMTKLEFFDEEGRPVKNKDGAYATEYVYYKYGRHRGMARWHASLDVAGRWMNDDYHNCGMLSLYEDGLPSKIMSFDRDSVLCHVYSEDSDSVCTYHFEYDEYGRPVRQTFYDENGDKDLSQAGVHGYEMEYNDRGMRVKVTCIDTLGNAVADRNGCLGYENECDEMGRWTRLCTKYVDSLLLEEIVWDGDDMLEHYNSRISNGDTVCTYSFRKDKELRTEELFWKDDVRLFKRFDDKGRQIEWAHFSADDPELPVNYHVDSRVYHKNITEYRDSVRFTFYTDKYYDADGNLLSNWTECMADSVSHQAYVHVYDSLDMYVSGHISVYDESNSVIIGQKSFQYDSLTRNTPHNDGYDSYDVSYIFSILPTNYVPERKDRMKESSAIDKIDISAVRLGLVGKNKMGDTGYFDNSGVPCYYWISEKDGSSTFYDENCNVIDPEAQEQMENIPSLQEVYLLNPVEEGFSYGFRGGDIVMETDGDDYYVVRYDFDSDSYRMFTVTLPPDIPWYSVISTAKRYYTDEEYAMIWRAWYEASVYCASLSSVPESQAAAAGIDKGVLLRYNDWSFQEDMDLDFLHEHLVAGVDTDKNIVYMDMETKEIRQVTLGPGMVGIHFEDMRYASGLVSPVLDWLEANNVGDLQEN